MIIDTQVNGYHSYARSLYSLVSTFVDSIKVQVLTEWRRGELDNKVQCNVDTFVELKWQNSIFNSHLNHSTFQEPWKQFCDINFYCFLYLIFLSLRFSRERWWRGDRQTFYFVVKMNAAIRDFLTLCSWKWHIDTLVCTSF